MPQVQLDAWLHLLVSEVILSVLSQTKRTNTVDMSVSQYRSCVVISHMRYCKGSLHVYFTKSIQEVING